MKNALAILAFTMVLGGLFAQGSKKTTTTSPAPSDPSKLHKDVYHQSLKSGDVTTAIIAVQYLLAAAPEQKSWRDTLTILYFQRGSYESAILTSQEILKEQPDNIGILEVCAVSKQSIGLLKESLEDYEKLYGLTKNWYHLYEIASLQLGLKRFGECELTAMKIAESPETADKTVSITTQAGQQAVPLNAAAWNVLGVIATQTNKIEEAKGFFKKALEIKTDFALAQANLAEIIKTQPDNK